MALIVYPNNKTSRPHTTVTIDDSKIGSTSAPSDKALVVFGSANGGKPGVLYSLSSYSQARSIFQGGELLDFIEMAWDPSSTNNGAGTIYAMRVEEATQAKLTRGPFDFVSNLYGAGANNIRVSLEDNKLTKSKRLSFKQGNTGEVYDHLGNIFNLQYTGVEGGATVTIADKEMVIKAGPSEATVEVMRYPLKEGGGYETISQIIADINAHEGFTASYIGYGDKNIKSKYLDEVSDIDIKTAYVVKSLVGDILRQTEFSAIIDVQLNDTEEALVNFPETALIGGSNGVVPTSWADRFQLLALDDSPRAYYVVALTPEASIHSELGSFVNEQTEAGFPLRAIVGGAKGETYAQTVARQESLNNPRVALVGFDAEVRMGDGRTVVQPAYMATAFIAGLASGLPIAEPVTFKDIKVASLTRKLTSDQLDSLTSAGVICAEKARYNTGSTFRLVSNVTTANTPDNPVRSEMALGEETDFLGMELTELFDKKFIGTKTLVSSASAIKMEIQAFLLTKKNAGEIQDYDANNISVVIFEDRADITFVVMPARGLNHISVGIVYEAQAIEA